MANTYGDLIPKIIGFAKEVMPEEFSLTGRMNTDFSGAAGKLGDTVTIGTVQSGEAVDITPANVAPDGVDIATGDRTLSISKFKGSKMVRLTGVEQQTYDLDSQTQQQVRESIRQVAFAFNAYAWERAALRVPYIAGTATQSIFHNGSAASVDPLADVKKVLRDNNNDMNMLDFVMTTTDEANVAKVSTVQQANTLGSDSMIINGSVGRLQGFNLFVDQQVPKHTIGSITTGLAAKATTAQAKGLETIVATTAATTGACALKAGDNLVIDGDSYVLQADATQAAAATDVNLSIFPPLRSALSGAEAITIATGAGTAYTELAGDMRGIAAVARIPATSFLGGMAQMPGTHIPVTEPNSGLTMMLSFYGQHFQGAFQTSLLYGVDVMDEDKLVKVYTHA